MSTSPRIVWQGVPVEGRRAHRIVLKDGELRFEENEGTDAMGIERWWPIQPPDDVTMHCAVAALLLLTSGESTR